jgi:phosphoglycerate dehydrogenase-like enzyme
VNIVVKGPLSDGERESILKLVPGAKVTACSNEELATHLGEAVVVLGSLTPAELAAADKLRLLQVTSAGVDRLLSAELNNSPAALCTASGIHGDTIAEHVLMMMLAMVRRLPRFIEDQKARVWQPMDPELLHGKVLGIVGFGAIGEAIGLRAKAFGMRVVGLRKHAERGHDSTKADEVWGEDQLDTLLETADHVVLAVPLTEQTRGLISRERLALMKPAAYIYNIARGPVIAEPALIEALAEGRIAGAGLDVVVEEPLPASSPLWEMPNVIITPHCAGNMPDYRGKAFAIFLENLRRLQNGESLINEVDKKAGY